MPTLRLGDEYWAGSDPLDPYLRWAERTDFRNLRRAATPVSQLSFIVERSSECSGWSELTDIDPKRVTVPKVYDEIISDDKPSTFATLRIDIKGLSPEEVNLLVRRVLTHDCVERLQLGYPRGTHVDSDGPVDRPKSARNAKVVLGIIDDGCPFAHPDLRKNDAEETRLAVLWQQTILDKAESPWLRPDDFEHGRVLNETAMNWLMTQTRSEGEVDELKCYQEAFATEEADLGYRKASREMLPRASHGGSVMAVAAGTPSELHGERPCYEAGNDLYGDKGDDASKCPIIFVDLPREQVEISSGRWISINALDGLRYIRREARRRFFRPDAATLPVVVNLSSGSTAGSHVGEAMLERAMDELLDADLYFAVTLAAGNSRTSESHAQLEVPRHGSAALGVFIPVMHSFDTFVELWLPAEQDLSKIVVEVRSADEKKMMVAKGRWEDVIGTDASDLSAALLFFPQVVQAKGRTMVLLAVAGTTTRTVPGTGLRWDSAAGPWLVTVRNSGDEAIVVQAWIERDEVVFGTRRDQAARFFAVDDEPKRARELLRRTHTMSNISTGANVFAVGAYRGLTASGPVAAYSGAPAQDWQSAEPKRYLPFAAKADAGRSHPGVRVPGNRGNVTRRMSGTSVSAPQAARFVVNEMAMGKSRLQIAAALKGEPERLPIPMIGYEPMDPDGPGLYDKPADPDALEVDVSDGRMRL